MICRVVLLFAVIALVSPRHGKMLLNTLHQLQIHDACMIRTMYVHWASHVTGDAASNATHFNDVICGHYGTGDPFSDFEHFEDHGYPTEIRIWHGDFIDR